MIKLFCFEYIVKDGSFYNSRMLNGDPDDFMYFYNWDMYLEERIALVVKEKKSIKEKFIRDNKTFLLDVEYTMGVDWNLRYTIYELLK